METKELLQEYIINRTSKLSPIPSVVQKGIDTISGDVPYRLKLGIALSELITFTSHLRKDIELYDGTLVPVNAIVFALSASGTAKDKSLNSIRRALSSGYEQIEEQRLKFAEEKARKAARLDGTGNADSEWRKYYIEPKPLQAGLGTVEGLMDHFADVAQNPIGAGSVLSSEIGSELQTNGHMTDIIKTLAVAYDLGNVPAKIVKSRENQTAALKGFPVNALFFGSHEALLFNNDIKAKFKLVFNTQLARRSIFTFTPEMPKRMKITSIDGMYEEKEKERERVLESSNALSMLAQNIIASTSRETLKLTPDANKLFDVYLEYNSILSDEESNRFPISKLSVKHKQWLSLKIAGCYAIWGGFEAITEEVYAAAINTAMFLSNDLTEFERELIKEPYEQFVDMCKYNAEEDEFFLSLHELRKLAYIGGSGSSTPKVDELVTLANSYDEEGLYSSTANGIRYQKINKSDVVGVSYKIFQTDLVEEELKNYMAGNSSSGFEFYETQFEELELLLEDNAAYGCFAFNNGERSKNNLTGSTKFIILDIDKSYISDVEAHTLLSDYNHYVVRTSDPNNEFKFRILLELDAPLDIDANTWKAFIAEVGYELGLTIDPLPQSQIFFSFKDRTILKQLDGDTIGTKLFLDRAAAKLKDKAPDPSTLPAKTKNAKLENPRETFSFAYEADNGKGSVSMYRALVYAIDLGADEAYLEELADQINNYWTVPMDSTRLQNTLINPAIRKLRGQ